MGFLFFILLERKLFYAFPKTNAMKVRNLILFVFMLFSLSAFQPTPQSAYAPGESFRYRIHYGFVNAGFATVELNEAVFQQKKVYHAIGRGYTTGMTKLFFKVEDDYQSFIDPKNGVPLKYIRKVYEGGYTKNQEGYFNHETGMVWAKDLKNQTDKSVKVPTKVQDILSSFYYLRNYPNIDKLPEGESVLIDMFFDDEVTKFKLKYLGKEDIKTKFGVVSCLKFRPYVQSGRVFKEQESLTVWVSDDGNKIPVRIKADLMVGSLKAEIDHYKGLKHPFITK